MDSRIRVDLLAQVILLPVLAHKYLNYLELQDEIQLIFSLPSAHCA